MAPQAWCKRVVPAMPVGGLRLPLEYHENGGIKTQLFAQKATVPVKGLIRGTGVRVEVYNEEGNIETLMTAEDFRYDRDNRSGRSKTGVVIERGSARVTGTGMKWKSDEQEVRIISDVTVTLGGTMRAGVDSAAIPADTGSTNVTVITSGQLLFDYGRNIAAFEDNVVVEDAEGRIESERLNVLFLEGGGMKSATAGGNVRLRHGDRVGSCEKAVYLARGREIVMSGDAVIRGITDSLSGRMITYRVDEEKMSCVEGKLVVSPETLEDSGLELNAPSMSMDLEPED